MSPREWGAATFDRVALPHHERATVVLDRLELAGHETVLDVGCGTAGAGLTELCVRK